MNEWFKLLIIRESKVLLNSLHIFYHGISTEIEIPCLHKAEEDVLYKLMGIGVDEHGCCVP